MPSAVDSLWPPLSAVRRALGQSELEQPSAEPAARAGATGFLASGDGESHLGTVQAGGGGANAAEAASTALLERTEHALVDLARRRAAVQNHTFGRRRASGQLLCLTCQGRPTGVLLDRPVVGGWTGWMTASEADWASAFDVLLEPQDGPFEPAFGVIQTWNLVTLAPARAAAATVVGELSATRLAAVRAVYDEWTAEAVLTLAPAPGQIALRVACDVFLVLTGTPLAAANDPRAAYQDLYLEAARALMREQPEPAPEVAAHASAPQPHSGSRSGGAATGGWRGWWAGGLGFDRLGRPALAALALVVVVQNAGLLLGGWDSDAVRFRSAPEQALQAAAAPPDLLVRWRDETSIRQVGELLRAASVDLLGGPLADGRWPLRSNDPVAALAALAASPLVQTVGPPGGVP